MGSAGFSAGNASYTSLAFSGGATPLPYVAYQDADSGYGTTVMRYNGANWENVGIPGFSAGNASYTSLAFSGDATPLPYVAYQDDGSGFGITVMRYDPGGGGGWKNVGNPGFSAGSGIFPSLAFDGVTPYVAFREDAANGFKVTVMRYNGMSWENVGDSAFSAGSSSSISLGISAPSFPKSALISSSF